MAGSFRAGSNVDDLAAALRSIAGTGHAWAVSSGRAALSLILRSMKLQADDPNRNEVIIPAYTCYSVPASIERAGLVPRLCDVDAATLGMDPESLRASNFSRVLAVVSANLYGIPNALGDIEQVCREHGVFFVDDAAQALGARVAGRAVGSFGDAGIYSFDKGKVISTMQGGAIVSRSGSLAGVLEMAVAKLPASRLIERAVNPAKLAFYSIFLRPSMYPIARALPLTGLGQTTYDTRYPVARLSMFSQTVAQRLLARLDELSAIRRRNVAALTAAVEGAPGIELVRPVAANPISAAIRFPMFARNPAMRARLIGTFQRSGIGATSSYPQALVDVPAVRARLNQDTSRFLGARKVAATIITLPTHAYCPENLPERVQQMIRECTG